MLDDRYYMRGSGFDTRRSLTVLLLILNAVLFIVQGALLRFTTFDVYRWFALSTEGLGHGYAWQLLTFQFMHGGWLHLLLNCWAIWMFGREVEENLGRKKFLALYLGSGVIGGMVQTLVAFLAPRYFGGEVVGASAGVFGLIAAFATLFPERQITMLLFFILPVTLSARMLLWVSGLLAAACMIVPMGNIAEAAHLGGLFWGVVFVRYVLNWEFRWPQLRRPRSPRSLVKVLPDPKSRWGARRPDAVEEMPADEFLSKEVDPILDKISAHGIQSLSERERRILEQARARMVRR